METITGTRAGTMVYVLDGHKYRKDKIIGTKTYLRCLVNTCRARGILQNGQFKETKKHNHDRQDRQIAINRLRNNLREAVQTTTRSIRTTFDEVSSRHGEAAHFVGFPSVRNMMCNAKSRYIPPVPRSLGQLAAILQQDEWAQYRLSEDGRPFFYKYMQAEEGDNFEAILFVSPGLGPKLDVATRIQADATFSIVPRNVGYQLLTIHFLFGRHMFPAVYALMSRKTEDGYRRIFTELVTNVCPNSKETVVQVMCDYELGMMNAAKDVWQGAKITGCYFHFAQAVYRKHQTRQLKTLTNKNPGAWRILQMSMSLPLLPAHLIEAGVQAIERFARNCGLQVMDTFIKYLRSHWLQTVGADRVSVHGFDQRTNNALEGFYSRLKRLMGPHTGVWNFLDHLRAVDKSHLLDYCRLEQGQQIKQPRRNKWLLKETNLTAAWADLEVAVTHLPPIDAAERFLYSVIHTVNRRPVPRISKGNTTARLPATVTAPNRSPLEANQPTCTEVGPSGASMFHLIQVNNDIVPVQYHIQPEAAGVVVVPLQPPEPLFTVVGYGTPIQTWQEREAGKVVVYTTTMGIVRDTYQRCLKVRQILRTHLVKFDEKDVFMSRETQAEIKERMSTDQIVVPQLFIEGQYIGDAEVVERLNETGELRRILKPYKSPDACTTCQVCGGYRLLPCAMCNGSKKSVHRNHFTTELVALKCMNCDEVGLVKCYAC